MSDLPALTTAKERADTVEAGLGNWRPRPGTLELSFEDTLYNALDSYGKGLAVLESTWQRIDEGLLPRCSHMLHVTRYGWNNEGNELGLLYQGSGETNAAWQPFPPDKFLIGVWQARSGVPGQTALLRCLAPYWCGITFGWEWLLNNAQIFGVPLRWATYDSNRADLLPKLTEMLANLGSAGWAAFPEGTTMEFKEAVSRATDNPQVMIQTYADKTCDLVILGQEASGESKAAGLGNGASDLHGAVRADRLQDAAQWCADLLNYQLVPSILRLNYGDESEPPTIVPDLAGEQDPKAKAERDQLLADMGLRIPTKYLYQRHAIPKPEDDEETIGGQGQGRDPEQFPPQGGSSGVDETAPGDAAGLPQGSVPAKSPQNDDLAKVSGKTPVSGYPPVKINSPRSAVALNATESRRGSFRKAVLPGAYVLSAEQFRSLLAARSKDFAPVRDAAEPLLQAIEAGDLTVVGELEALIARLDKLAPDVIGARELSTALEATLAEAAIQGAAASYGKISTTKPTQ